MLRRQVRPLDVVLIVLLTSTVALASMATMFYKIEIRPESPGDTWGLRVYDSSGTLVFEVDNDGAEIADGNFVVDGTTGNITTAGGETPTDYIQLPIAMHTATNALMVTDITTMVGTAGLTGREASAPLLEISENILGIMWPNMPNGYSQDGMGLIDPRKAVVTFRVPANYSSTPVITMAAASDGVASKEKLKVDYEYFFNSTGASEDAAAFNNEPIALAGNNSTPEDLVLTMGTVDQAALSVGDWVTVRYWRSRVQQSGAKLRSRGLVFSYVKKH